MDDELVALEKEFVLEHDLEHEDIKKMVREIIPFSQIDINGYVSLTEKGKSAKMADQVMLVLMARYLGHKLFQKLEKEIKFKDALTAEEISGYISGKKEVVSARLKELKDDGKVTTIDTGTFKVTPHSIRKFFREMGT